MFLVLCPPLVFLLCLTLISVSLLVPSRLFSLTCLHSVITHLFPFFTQPSLYFISPFLPLLRLKFGHQVGGVHKLEEGKFELIFLTDCTLVLSFLFVVVVFVVFKLKVGKVTDWWIW